jgi:7-cyano-7-deazaguanine synthase
MYLQRLSWSRKATDTGQLTGQPKNKHIFRKYVFFIIRFHPIYGPMSEHKKKALILHSGGLDSTTVLALAIRDGFNPYTMTFRYGQRHIREMDAAREIAEKMNVVRRIVVDITPTLFEGSALTDNTPAPRNRTVEEISAGIPVTYVPARNTVFLSYALAWAESLGSHDIFIGVNAVDYSGYPDCRPEFIEAFERLANLATKEGVEGRRITIHAPLIGMTKAEIIRIGISLGVDYSLTHSCYDPSPEGLACGMCDSCILREKGFAEAGTVDPARRRTSGID